MEQPKIKKTRPKEIRVTFKEKEEFLYEFVKSKKSISAYVKELIQKDLEGTKNQDDSSKIIEQLMSKILDLSKDVSESKEEHQQKERLNTYDDDVTYEGLDIETEEEF
jgi:hypothetical protein